MDIVQRLRNSLLSGDHPEFYMLRHSDIAEAAGEIERLRREQMNRPGRTMTDDIARISRDPLTPEAQAALDEYRLKTGGGYQWKGNPAIPGSAATLEARLAALEARVAKLEQRS